MLTISIAARGIATVGMLAAYQPGLRGGKARGGIDSVGRGTGEDGGDNWSART